MTESSRLPHCISAVRAAIGPRDVCTDERDSSGQYRFAGCLFQLAQSIAEKMVCRFNPGQGLGLGGFCENGFHGGTPPVLIVRTVEKMSRATTIGEKFPFKMIDRRPDGKKAFDAAAVAANDAKPDKRAERKPRRQQRQARLAVGGIAQHRADIILLANAFVISAGALADAPKIEPYDRRPRVAGRSGQPENYLVVHRPAVQRMRMANDSHSLDGNPVVRALDEGLQASRGAVDKGRFEQPSQGSFQSVSCRGSW